MKYPKLFQRSSVNRVLFKLARGFVMIHPYIYTPSIWSLLISLCTCNKIRPYLHVIGALFPRSSGNMYNPHTTYTWLLFVLIIMLRINACTAEHVIEIPQLSRYWSLVSFLKWTLTGSFWQMIACTYSQQDVCVLSVICEQGYKGRGHILVSHTWNDACYQEKIGLLAL